MFPVLRSFVLIQAVNADYPAPADPGPGGDPLLTLVLASLASLGSLLYMAFMIWMVVECVRKDPDRWIWLWVIMLFQPAGAAIYFFVRWLPGHQVRLPAGLRRFTRGRELARLEIAAQQIGNPHQYVQWGDALRDVRKYAQAEQAYARALERDADHLQALWGAALVDIQQGKLKSAEGRLHRVLELDPKYKFGDVSLEYGKTLHRLGKDAEAFTHLEGHINRWRHPEALYLLAELHAGKNEPEEARRRLQEMLMDINGSPKAIARRHTMWKSRARRRLRRLPRG